eukprot:767696-Hanusia_phi.AAC.6
MQQGEDEHEFRTRKDFREGERKRVDRGMRHELRARDEERVQREREGEKSSKLTNDGMSMVKLSDDLSSEFAILRGIQVHHSLKAASPYQNDLQLGRSCVSGIDGEQHECKHASN